MLRPVLGDLHTQVGGVHDILSDAVDFVSEDHGVAAARLAPEILERDGMLGLLGADDGPTLPAEAAHECERVTDMLPGHAVLGPQGGFVDLGRRRDGADAAQPDLVHLEAVSGPEGAAHIVRAADIVQHEHHPGRRETAVIVRPDPAQLNI